MTSVRSPQKKLPTFQTTFDVTPARSPLSRTTPVVQRQEQQNYENKINMEKYPRVHFSPKRNNNIESKNVEDNEVKLPTLKKFTLDLDDDSIFTKENLYLSEEERKRREHERTVQSLIDTLRQDLEQERKNVKQLLTSERELQKQVSSLQTTIDRHKVIEKDLTNNLYKIRQEADAKERFLQRTLTDCSAWKNLASKASEKERLLEAELLIERKRPHNLWSQLNEISLGKGKKTKLRQLQALLEKSQQEITYLKNENTTLSSALIEARKQQIAEKSTDSLLLINQIMVRTLSSVVDLEDQLIESFREEHEDEK